MNKRIEELVKECSVQEWTSVHGKSMRFEPGQVEKFAELIVRECADVAYGTYWQDPAGVRGIYLKDAILEHFGVE